MRILFLTFSMLVFAAVANAQWVKQTVDTTASFRGLAVVNEKVVWASGTGGTVIRTTDGGKTWKVMIVPGAEKLDFRDIEAFDANTAYILSIGNGESSRIYKTTDGGKTWGLQFKNDDPKKFFDAIACSGPMACIAVSDPASDFFSIIVTSDGGAKWALDYEADGVSRLRAVAGEAAFAASGTCLIEILGKTRFLVTGGMQARVFKGVPTQDYGAFGWHAVDTPIIRGTSGSGIFSIAMFDQESGVIVGGNYEKPNEAKDNLAFTTDGGTTWNLGKGLSGYRSGVTYVDQKTLVAVGTNGSDISRDGGSTWLRIDDANYNAVQAKGRRAVWAVGPKGHVTRLDWQSFLATNELKPCGRNRICDGPWVTDIQLSRTEINSACPTTDSACAKQRQIEVSTFSPDVPSNWYAYTVSGGQILGMGSNVVWDLTDAKPGTYTITAGLKTPFASHFEVFGKTVTKVVTVK